MASMTALAAPSAAIAAFAYLNARWRLSVDYGILSNHARAIYLARQRPKSDRMNSFYPLEEHALNMKTADKIFMIYEDRQWTFRSFYDTVLRYAGWLHATYAVAPGEVIAIDFMNSPQFLFLVMALWSLGATPALINYNLTGKPLIHSIKTSGARLLIVEPELESKVLTDEIKAVFASPTFRNGAFPVPVVVLHHTLQSSLEYYKPYRAPDTSRAGAQTVDVCTLISTSGTTGLPKQTIVPWGRCWGIGIFVSGWIGLRSVTSSKPDRYYISMPLYHGSAFMGGFHMCLVHPTTFVLSRRFSATKFWPEVRHYEATIIQYVGETLRYLVNAPVQADEKEHKVRLAFGNGLRPDVWKKFKSRFGIETIAEFYGATEGVAASWNFNNNDFSDGAIGQNGKVTQLLLSRSQAIVKVDWDVEQPWRDPNTNFCVKLPKGQPGELIFKVDAADVGATYLGYLNNKKASDEKILRDVFVKGDAYFRTGDVVRWDENGLLWFADRIGDTFRWKSENVSTMEVSEIIGYHPQVQGANVYGVTVPGHDGRAGCAAILFKDSALVDGHNGVDVKAAVLESLASYAITSLPRFSVPVFVRAVREMKMTGNNKHQKQELRVEGVELGAIEKGGSGDRLYWLKPGAESYTLFSPQDLGLLANGKARL